MSATVKAMTEEYRSDAVFGNGCPCCGPLRPSKYWKRQTSKLARRLGKKEIQQQCLKES